MDNRLLTVIDHAVSKESFNLIYDSDLDMLRTDPVPDSTAISRYYESADYISHTDSKDGFFERVYRLVRRYTIARKLQLIKKESQKGSLLDIGAGTANFVYYAQKKGWDAVGIEPNKSARNVAQAKGVFLRKSTAAIADASQEVITMWHVLEHVSNFDQQIEELRRLLKPDGVIFVAVPNFKSYDATYYCAFWAGYDVPRHLSHFSRKSIKQVFEQHDMKVKKCFPMCFDAYYVSLLSEKYKTGRMHPRAFFIATWSNIKAIFTGEYSSLIYIIRNK